MYEASVFRLMWSSRMVLQTSFRKADDCMEYPFGISAADTVVYLSFWNDIPQLRFNQWLGGQETGVVPET